MQFLRLLVPKLNQQRKLNVLPDVGLGNTIPKIIHQIFPTRQLPDEIEENVSRLKAMNPSWEYRFYKDKDIPDFITQNYNDKVLEYTKRINSAYGAARADLFRYLVIYTRRSITPRSRNRLSASDQGKKMLSNLMARVQETADFFKGKEIAPAKKNS